MDTDLVCRLDEKTSMFTEGLDILAQRLTERYYTSVSDFSRDLSEVFREKLATTDNLDPTSGADLNAIHSQLNEVAPGTAEHHALSAEQKDLKRLAKRIVKAVKELTEEAAKREADLRGLHHEETMRKIESFAMFADSTTKSIEADDTVTAKADPVPNGQAVAGASPADDVQMRDADARTEEVDNVKHDGTNGVVHDKATPASKANSTASSTHEHTIKTTSSKPTEPLSPPISTTSIAQPRPGSRNTDPGDVFANGGVAWYLGPFDPMGTTVHEERYTGRAVLRDMSEELSDMDEDTLMELEANGLEDASADGTPAAPNAVAAAAGVQQQKKKPKRKGKRAQWSRSRR